jgi:hypothetical protein
MNQIQLNSSCKINVRTKMILYIDDNITASTFYWLCVHPLMLIHNLNSECDEKSAFFIASNIDVGLLQLLYLYSSRSMYTVVAYIDAGLDLEKHHCSGCNRQCYVGSGEGIYFTRWFMIFYELCCYSSKLGYGVFVSRSYCQSVCICHCRK